MKIALDATYSLGDALSGVGVYSRELVYGLAAAEPGTDWEWYYRSRRFWRATLGGNTVPRPANVRARLLSDSWGSRSALLFHGLNQRLPRRKFRRQAVTFHDLFVLSGDYSTAEFRTRFAAQAKEAAAAADVIIAVSAFTGRQVEQLLNIPASRIRVIHHGVLPRAVPTLPREKIVLCVGAIQRRKNQAGLVRAFQSLPADWKLVLAGSCGFGSEETLQAIAQSNCAERIQLTGYITDQQLAELYGRAGIFAFPSFDEGFGMPVLEAMAAGVPVITSNRSALPEIAGDAALLINPEFPEEIGQGLVRLADDKAFTSEKIALGKRHVETFTWERAVKATADTYSLLM